MAFNLKRVFSFGNAQPAEPTEEIDEAAEAAARAQAWARLSREQSEADTQTEPASSPEIPAQPAEPFVPSPPPEPPAAPVEVPAQPTEPSPSQAPPEVPDSPVGVPVQPAEPFQPAQPQEAPPAREPAAPQPSAPPEVPEPSAPLEAALAYAGPLAEEFVPSPPLPSAVPPERLAPSTARQRFGDRVEVGKAVGRREDAVSAQAQAAPRNTWLQRMRAGLSRSSRELSDNLSGVFTKGKLTEEFTDELEEVLIRSDFGADTAMRITDALTEGRFGLRTTEREIRDVLAGEIGKVLQPVAKPLELDLSRTPHVILVVGVNGTGKTTTIGKLAAKLTAGGLSVMLAAGDTFRAAAIEQLKIWGERTNSPVVASKLGADAAGLAFEAFERAKQAGADVLIIDTAGRLQNKTELMAELEKIVRVLRKLDPDAPHTVLQTLDATTGQNALNQVDIFRSVAGVSGLVMTKLDGTARGGILVAIAAKHRLPVYFIGVGEGVDDLEPFSARDFAQTIAGTTYG